MLARREMPKEYRRWNRAWGVPDGKHLTVVGTVERLPRSAEKAVLRSAAVRRSNAARSPSRRTRRPVRTSIPGPTISWPALGPSRVLEIGGALSGLQFVLAKDGHEVHNVDPFLDYGKAYDLDPIAEHASLNRIFGTDVVLHRATLPEAD